jgi:hypothetical protein
MQQHVKILAILHIAFGALGVLVALIVMLGLGGVAALIHLSDASPDAALGTEIVGLVGAVITIVVLVLSLPGLIAGIGLLNFQPWARIMMIVLCAIELPGVPVHTAMGIYGLWVLMSTEGTALFNRPVVARA